MAVFILRSSSKKKLLKFLLFTILVVTLGAFLKLQASHPVMAKEEINQFPQQPEKRQNDDTTSNEENTGKYEQKIRPRVQFTEGRRTALILVGFSRSGTSFISHVFNQDPSIFSVYEPLQICNHWRPSPKEWPEEYSQAVTDIITAHMTCSFAGNYYAEEHLKAWSRTESYRMQSNTLASPPFCTQAGNFSTCSNIVPETLDKVCLNNRKHSVIKICYERVPGPLYKIPFLQSLVMNITKTNPEFDIKIVNIVRDPRGLVNSRINFNWIPDFPSPLLASKAARVCDVLSENIEAGRNFTGWIKTNYKELQYDEFFSNPVEKARELYEFAGFHPIPENVLRWVDESTNVKVRYTWSLGLKRNSTLNLSKWLLQSPW